MTREIALHCMKSASELEHELCEECPIYGQTGCDHCFEDALQYVIGMLEQESILDKIRVEIVERDKKVKAIRSDDCCFFTADEILEILDKYKAETENT